MTDRVFAIAGDWAVGADELQWILMRRRMGSQQGWRPVSFVRSTRDILARCMREKGVDVDTADLLLAGLPDSFDRWKDTQAAQSAS
jgi:hypothetical protein